MLSLQEVWVAGEAVIDTAQLHLAAGSSLQYQMKLEKRGQYRISLVCRAPASAPDTTQLPLSLFVDSQLLGTKTLTGAEKAWQTISFDTRDIRRRLIFYTKLFFPVGGLELREIRITRIQTFE